MKKTIAGIVGLGLSFLFVPAAHADRVNVNHGKDVGFGNTTTDAVGVEDRECDGNDVFVHYRLRRNGDIETGRLKDYNGCTSGSAKVNFINANVLEIKLCEDAVNYDCTRWYVV